MLRLFSRNAGEFYNGKETLPVFDWNPKAKTPIEIFHILMKRAEDLTTCKRVPSLISHNVCFLLDVRNLASENDWKSDDMGSWKNNGEQRLRYHVGQDENVILENDENRENAGKTFTMKRIHYKNNTSPDVKKIASFFEGTYNSSSRFFLLLRKLQDTKNGLIFIARVFSSSLHSIFLERCRASNRTISAREL